jgi:hypothetical protein
MMNLKRTAIFGVLGAGCAAMLAGAMTTGRPDAVVSQPAGTRAVELQGAALGKEIARLRARLRPTVEPREPSRNLFEFGRSSTSRAPRSRDVEPSVDPVPVTEPIAPPPLKLVGLAEDTGADGPVRTAFISGLGDVFLAKEGDVLGARYQVTQISAMGVILTDLVDQTIIRLSIQ